MIFPFLLLINTCFAQTKEISSPGNRIKIIAEIKNGLHYSVYFDNKQIVSASQIDLSLENNNSLLSKAVLKKSSAKQVRETIIPGVAEKRKLIPDNYNELVLSFKQSFAVIFRAYDDGVAYRFQTSFKDSITIENETAVFNFPEKMNASLCKCRNWSSEILYFVHNTCNSSKAIAFSPLMRR